jgi:hypothetical protein
MFYPWLSQRLNDHLQGKLDPLQHKKQDTKQPTGAMRWYSTKQEKKPNWGNSNKLPRLSIWRLVYKALAALQYRDRKTTDSLLTAHCRRDLLPWRRRWVRSWKWERIVPEESEARALSVWNTAASFYYILAESTLLAWRGFLSIEFEWAGHEAAVMQKCL